MDPNPKHQKTLKTAFRITGQGLHTGLPVTLEVKPAAEGTGFAFYRTDTATLIPAVYSQVTDTRLSTVLSASGSQISVATVEHLMAALWGLGIDNALIEIDGPEVPVMDGSARDFVALIDRVGIREQKAVIRCLEILKPVKVENSHGYAEFLPLSEGKAPGFYADIFIDFPDEAIGRERSVFCLTPEFFKAELAEARTFTMARDIPLLQAAGLIRGGGLHNAVVVDQGKVVNSEGLRMKDEFVRHKALDAVGDMALAGVRILGELKASCGGHELHNKLLRKLFLQPQNFRFIPPEILENAA